MFCGLSPGDSSPLSGFSNLVRISISLYSFPYTHSRPELLWEMLHSVLRGRGSSEEGNSELPARHCLAALYKTEDLEELGMDELHSTQNLCRVPRGGQELFLRKVTSMPSSLTGVQTPGARRRMGCACSAGLLQRKERATKEMPWNKSLNHDQQTLARLHRKMELCTEQLLYRGCWHL